MKKLLALLLAAVMCLSLVACGGGETPNTDDNSGTEQGAESGDIKDTNTENNSNSIPEVDYTKILLNEGCFWSYVNYYSAGFGFMEDGTTINPDGTYELVDNTVSITLEDGNTISYEIKDINGVYYLVGNRDIFYGVQISIEQIPYKTVEITNDNWQEYFELDATYGVKLKDEYQRIVIGERCENIFDIQFTSNGVECSGTMRCDSFYFILTSADYNSNESFEMKKIQGTLYFIDGI